MFGIQGLIGGVLASGWKKVATNYWTTSSISASVLNDFGEQFGVYAALISAGFGLGFGIIASLIIYWSNIQLGHQYY